MLKSVLISEFFVSSATRLDLLVYCVSYLILPCFNGNRGHYQSMFFSSKEMSENCVLYE